MRRVFLLLAFAASLFAGDSFLPIKNLYYDLDKARIGKRLFTDVRLSPSGKVSCESCHNLYWRLSGTMKENINMGSGGMLNPPTVLNAALNYLFFIDGSVRDLREQIKSSINDINELGSSENFIVKKVLQDPVYRTLFKEAYPNGATYENIVDAFAHFESALITPNSKFDAYLRGDENALTPRQKAGFELFKSRGCSNCHNGVNLGANVIYGRESEGDSVFSQIRIPGLRNVVETGPYDFDGSVIDLRDMIRFMNYNYAGKIKLNNDQVELIYEFLCSLSGERPEILNEK